MSEASQPAIDEAIQTLSRVEPAELRAIISALDARCSPLPIWTVDEVRERAGNAGVDAERLRRYMELVGVSVTEADDGAAERA